VPEEAQLAVEAIESYQSVVSLSNTSLRLALAANRTIHDTLSFLSSVDQLQADVNQSVVASQTLKRTIDQLNNTLTASG